MKKCNVICVVNQKGGVSKTTTTLNVGVALARLNNKVLVIDFDPQGNLTVAVGLNGYDESDKTIAKLMFESLNEKPLSTKDIIVHIEEENIDIIPSNIDLANMDNILLNTMYREEILKEVVNSIKDNYDYIIIDCGPNLGVLAINALTASDYVVIPTQAQYLSARGMSDLFKTITKIKRKGNPKLKILGILISIVNRRTTISKEMIQVINDNFSNTTNVFKTIIPERSIVQESSAFGKSLFAYKKKTNLTNIYSELAKEIIDMINQEQKDN